MKHIIHGKDSPQIPSSYDAMAEFKTFGSEVILTTYGLRGGVRGYICLDKYELMSLLIDLLVDFGDMDYQCVINRLSEIKRKGD